MIYTGECVGGPEDGAVLESFFKLMPRHRALMPYTVKPLRIVKVGTYHWQDGRWVWKGAEK